MTEKDRAEPAQNVFVGKLAKLVEVKSLTTFALVGVLCYLAVKQNTPIPTELYTAVVSAVITYFFTRKNSQE